MKRLLLTTSLLTATALGVVACADHGPARPGDPRGSAAERAIDRNAGTNTSGAYPRQSDGTPGNPPGTAAERAYDRATGSNTSGAYPGR